jgi:hypothetical protein
MFDMEVIALILGILSLLVSWVPIVGVLLGILAIVLGFVAIGRTKKQGEEPMKPAIVGIVTGGLGAVLGVVLLPIVLGAFTFYIQRSRAAGEEAQAREAAQEQMLLERAAIEAESHQREAAAGPPPSLPTNDPLAGVELR